MASQTTGEGAIDIMAGGQAAAVWWCVACVPRLLFVIFIYSLDSMPPAEETDHKKRGKACDFQGARMDCLVSYLPKYASLSKARKTPTLWPDVFSGYWAAFSWRLPLNQEPDPGDPTDYARDPEGKEEAQKNTEVLQEVEKVSECTIVHVSRLTELPRKSNHGSIISVAPMG